MYHISWHDVLKLKRAGGGLFEVEETEEQYKAKAESWSEKSQMNHQIIRLSDLRIVRKSEAGIFCSYNMWVLKWGTTRIL